MHNLYYISNFGVATKILAIKYLGGKKLRSLKLVTKKSVIDQSGKALFLNSMECAFHCLEGKNMKNSVIFYPGYCY